MKRKNYIQLNSIRAIQKALPRFFSLMVMSMLGVFTFSGLQATAPDMLKTLDQCLDRSNSYDIQIISNMGLIQEDINELEKINGIQQVEGSYSKDILVRKENTESVINVSSMPIQMNTLQLIEGKFPTEANEIVVEPNLLLKSNLKIGDILYLNDEVFQNKEVKIVGTIHSNLYLNSVKMHQNRGNTSIGSGTIDYYTYVLADNFKQDYYSSIYVTVKNAKEMLTSSNQYEKLINQVNQNIDKIKLNREKTRYQQLYQEMNDEITQKEKNANQELTKAKEELQHVKSNLKIGKEKLNKVHQQLKNFKQQLKNAKLKLNNTKKQLVSFKSQLELANKQIKKAQIEMNAILEKYNMSKEEIPKKIQSIEEVLEFLPNSYPKYQIYQQQLKSLKQLEETKNIIEDNEKKYDKNLEQYQQAETEYKRGLASYHQNFKKYNQAAKSYQKNLEKYKINLSKLQVSETEYKKNEIDIKKQINDAKEELSKIETPTWYIQNRTDNSTYSDYIDDTNSITNLSKLFPTVFFAVAILVSLISMNRMVEEDRLEIGTLKSLGFSNNKIMRKYLIFSFLATLFGGIIGSIFGLTIIPLLIFNIYGMLFDIPHFQFGLNLGTTILSFVIMMICVCGTTIITVYKVLKEKPSDLMRPKAPKLGKRVLLEKISFVWSHIQFSQKVTIRNLFRYKKRVLVTVIGIAGCTALMLCGFGIRDAIIDVVDRQYDFIYQFDASSYTNHIQEKDLTKIFNDDNITRLVQSQTISAKVKGIDVNLWITKNSDELKNVVNLINIDTQKTHQLETGKVIITEKLADIANIKVGDTIEILDVNNKLYQYPVSAIVNNYFGHFIYMDQSTFEQSKVDYQPNIVYMNTKELNEEQRKHISENLLQKDEIINVSFKASLKESADNMLQSLNKVVIILVILAAMLAFVVLYNLSNINIMERKREISTLKVLGFYNKEVDHYITKENTILTVLGIIIGLIAGYFLTKIVISTVEIEKARFIYQIKVSSYFFASLLSIGFTLIVNMITHFNLKKIDMIESLKSIE